MKLLWTLLFIILSLNLCAEKKHVVLVAGTHHYSPQITLEKFSQDLQEAGFSTELVKTDWDPEKDSRGLPGLAALDKADIAVLFIRFLKLDDEQLKPLMNFVKSGKPVLALRTTSHAFYYPEGHKNFDLNNGFGVDVMGTPFYLHMKGTTENTPKVKNHEILKNAPDKFKSYGTLYRVTIPESATVLTEGYAKTTPRIHKNIFGEHKIGEEEYSPTTWTWINKYGGKTVGSTFGHKKDFQDKAINNILINCVKWLSKK